MSKKVGESGGGVRKVKMGNRKIDKTVTPITTEECQYEYISREMGAAGCKTRY